MLDYVMDSMSVLQCGDAVISGCYEIPDGPTYRYDAGSFPQCRKVQHHKTPSIHYMDAQLSSIWQHSQYAE